MGFIDEMYNVIAPLNLWRFGLYSPDAIVQSGVIQVGYESSVSSGIVTTWPAGVGWLYSKNLFGARLAFMIWNFVGILALGFLVSKWMESKKILKNIFWICLGYLGAFLCVPYFHVLSTMVLGEAGGAILLGIAYTQLWRRPELATFLLGVVVWHTKFIYLPFALVGIAAQVATFPPKEWIKRSFYGFLIMMAPLLLWWVVILATAGGAGFWKYLTVQTEIFFGFLKGYSSVVDPEALAKTQPVKGLFNRLTDPKMEWSFYALSDKVKIVSMLFIPPLLLGYRVVMRRLKGREDLPRDVLEVGIGLSLLAFAYWYFFMHIRMWIRHLDPALMVGYGVIVFCLLEIYRAAKESDSAFARVMFYGVMALFIYKEGARSSVFFEMIRNPAYEQRYSVKTCTTQNALWITHQDLLKICL